ncbi:hypothetical protein LCGC14_0141410 [marine sediment metagenome]|uniref:Uncharacterized protein n=1 Tax=marine sediment metagenome TaxID=412755 RepID=A0A0F9V104_9ZZZZ
MSTKNTHRQKYPHFGKKGDSPHKHYSNRAEIIKKKGGDMPNEVFESDGGQIQKHAENPSWEFDDSDLIKMYYWRDRCRLAEKLIQHVLTRKDVGRALHIHGLEEKLRKLQEEMTHQRIAAEVRNKQLKAANMIVCCTGGCEGGIIGSSDKVEEELVVEVERTAKRLRQWWENRKHRLSQE